MHKRRSLAGQTRRLATCSVLCALAVVVMGLGALVEIMDLTAAALAALVILPILLTYGTRYALLSYAVTGVLGVILMPQSLTSWLFLGLVGYYPVIKAPLDRLPRWLGYLIKALLVGAVLTVYLAVFYFIFMQGKGTLWDAFLHGFGEPDGASWLPWALVGLSLFTFFLFDLLIDRLLIIYRIRWKRRLDKWMK